MAVASHELTACIISKTPQEAPPCDFLLKHLSTLDGNPPPAIWSLSTVSSQGKASMPQVVKTLATDIQTPNNFVPDPLGICKLKELADSLKVALPIANVTCRRCCRDISITYSAVPATILQKFTRLFFRNRV